MPYYGARIRAARAYANLSQEELAERLGVSPTTVKRRELPRGHCHLKQPKKGELLAIAQICGVPAEFLDDGFGGTARDEISERLAEQQDVFEALRVDLAALDLEVLQQLAEVLDAVRDVQARMRR